MSKNCMECKHIEDNGVDAGSYQFLCTHPNLESIAEKSWVVMKQKIAKVRTEETRQFKFACGIDAQWFENKRVEV